MPDECLSAAEEKRRRDGDAVNRSLAGSIQETNRVVEDEQEKRQRGSEGKEEGRRREVEEARMEETEGEQESGDKNAQSGATEEKEVPLSLLSLEPECPENWTNATGATRPRGRGFYRWRRQDDNARVPTCSRFRRSRGTTSGPLWFFPLGRK